MPLTRLGAATARADTELGVDAFVGRPNEQVAAPIDAANLDSVLGQSIHKRGFLTNDVKTADLSKYSDKQLEGRRRYYEREYTFERNERIRAENKVELDRTNAEIHVRLLRSRQSAERHFKEPRPIREAAE